MRALRRCESMMLLRVLLAALTASALMAGCGDRKDETASAPTAPAAQTAASAPATTETAAPQQVPIVPAPAVTQTSWSAAALEELLAPIALYPDQLLTQILAASVNTQEVLDGGNWLLQNQSLKGNALDSAAQQAGFGPSLRALLQFPTVVDMLCQQIDWTRQLGAAFTSDQKAVLDAVQRLRAQAAQAGNLKSTPQQTVETKTAANTVIVEVKPADPKVVYVPQYDPQAVYTTQAPAPAPASAPTTTEEKKGVSTGAAIATGLLAFGAGVMLAHALDDDDYCYPNWGHGAVYYGPRPFYPPAYVYRPVYTPAFRPAYRYAPPPSYRYRYNSDTNIVINNNNYYNRFENNRNLHVGGTQSPLRTSPPALAQQRVGEQRVGGTAAVNRAGNWQGQSTYTGARNVGGTERTASAQRAGTQRSVGAAQPNPPTAGAASAYRSARVDRGYGDTTRVASRDTSADSRPQLPVNAHSDSTREHALAGASETDGGAMERAASARGRASAGGRLASDDRPRHRR